MRLTLLLAGYALLAGCAGLGAPGAPGGSTAAPAAVQGVCVPETAIPAFGQVQMAANALAAELERHPRFGGARWEREPCARLLLGFTDRRSPSEVVASAPAILRPYLAVVTTRFSKAEKDAAQRALVAAAQRERLAVVSMFSPLPERWELFVLSEADAVRVRALVPELYRSLLRIQVNPSAFRSPLAR